MTRFGHSTSGQYQCNFLLTVKQNSLADRCPKNGDVPKSPFPQLAALVPSVGTVSILKSILVLIAGAAGICILHIRALPTACVLTGKRDRCPGL